LNVDIGSPFYYPVTGVDIPYKGLMKAMAIQVTNKVLFTKREAAQMLSISVRSIDYLIFNQQLPTRRIGRRVLVHRDAIEQFARRDHAFIRAEVSSA
jgi:excisionase family DNA binding protein